MWVSVIRLVADSVRLVCALQPAGGDGMLTQAVAILQQQQLLS